MSEVIYLDTRRFTGSVQSDSTLSTGPRVYVREAREGIWLVHDEDDFKGGCFRNRQSAFHFVAEEFDPQAIIVVQPRFPVQARQRVSHFRESASVAHRAVVAQ
jgi:hypothetical protein